MAASAQAYYELYQHSSMGITLKDTIDDLITDGSIQAQLAMKILSNYDRVMAETLQKSVRTRLTFKGSLENYRLCDEVWTFQLRNVNFKMDGNAQVSAEKIKIVSCSARRPGEA